MDSYVRDGFAQIAYALESGDGGEAKRVLLQLVDYMGGRQQVIHDLPPEHGMLYVLSLAIGRLYV